MANFLGSLGSRRRCEEKAGNKIKKKRPGAKIIVNKEIEIVVYFSNFSFPVLNRLFNFVRVCPNYKQGIAYAID